MIHWLIFVVFGVISVAGAVNLLAQRHPINSALSLIAVLASLAVEYLLLGAEFVAAVQVIVYAGAIMVLFVFTIMLLNAGEEERTPGSRVAILFGVPGMLVRSVTPDATGMPVMSAGGFITDHRSPLKERWGGWYVSGTTGDSHRQTAHRRNF